MGGTVKVNAVQLGDDAIATRNLVIRSNVDGSFTLARGNLGATTQDILTIDASGRVTQAQAPGFSAYQSVSQTVAAALTKVNYQTKVLDSHAAFDTALMRFTAPVAGWYQLSASISMGGATSVFLGLYKNGAFAFEGVNTAGNVGVSASLSAPLFLAAGDYVEVFMTPGVGTTLSATQQRTTFSGFFLKPA